MADTTSTAIRSRLLRTVGAKRLADKFCIRREVDTNQNDRPLYEGYTLPGLGQQPGSAVWAIRKFTYTGTNTTADTEFWASGVSDFAYIWDNRATYTYR